jgi:dienelactone hydrolase
MTANLPANYDKISQATLSNSGTFIAFVINEFIYIKSVCSNSVSSKLIDSKGVPLKIFQNINSLSWSLDDEYLIYMAAQLADELPTYHFYSLKTQQVKGLYENISEFPLYGGGIQHSISNPALLRLSSYSSHPLGTESAFECASVVNFLTGEIKAHFPNTGEYKYLLFDEHLNPRVRFEETAEGGCAFITINKDNNIDQICYDTTWEFHQQITQGSKQVIDDNLYLLIPDAENMAVGAVNLKTNELSLVSKTSNGEAKYWGNNPATGIPDLFVFEGAKIFYQTDSDSTQKKLNFLDSSFSHNYHIIDRSNEDTIWLVAVTHLNTAEDYFIINFSDLKITKVDFNLFSKSANPTCSVNIIPFTVEAKDGLPLQSYLTYAGTESSSVNFDNVPSKPLIVNIHGGPWIRDSYECTNFTRWLVSKGYNVLTVNYRGSKGISHAVLNASIKNFGKGQVEDIKSSVNFLKEKNIILDNKICAYGSSYGGYLALMCGIEAGSFFTSVIACNIVPTSPEKLHDIASWIEIKKYLEISFGDPENDADMLRLRENSPLYRANELHIPVLLSTGEKDTAGFADDVQNIAKVAQKGNENVHMAIFSNQYHGYNNPLVTEVWNASIEKFLSLHLGEPFSGFNITEEHESMISNELNFIDFIK